MIDGIARNLLLFAGLCTTLGQIWKVTQQNFYTTSPYTDKHKNILQISVIINLLHWILKILFCLYTNVIKEWNLASRKIWFLGKISFLCGVVAYLSFIRIPQLEFILIFCRDVYRRKLFDCGISDLKFPHEHPVNPAN